jgi:hypothetical protein
VAKLTDRLRTMTGRKSPTAETDQAALLADLSQAFAGVVARSELSRLLVRGSRRRSAFVKPLCSFPGTREASRSRSLSAGPSRGAALRGFLAGARSREGSSRPAVLWISGSSRVPFPRRR